MVSAPVSLTRATEVHDARLLVVDDEPANVRLLELLLARWGYENVVSTTESSDVVALYREVGADLLVLDLQMPAPDGFELMELLADEIHGHTRLPVLVLTADATPEVKRRALASGARDFLTKPFDPTEVELRIRNLLDARRLQLELQHQNQTLEERVRARTHDLDRARLETLECLALAGEYRDDNTHEHAQRVGRTVAALATSMGISPAVAERLRRAAPLHDIGKIGIPDAILLKPARLDESEFRLMKAHTTIGHQILSGSGSRVLQLSADIALTHHERWDGRGYPNALAGEEIPVGGRLTAAADVFDALMHRRPYKEAWTLGAALTELISGSGRRFDPAVIEAFSALDHEALLSPISAEPAFPRAIANGGAD